MPTHRSTEQKALLEEHKGRNRRPIAHSQHCTGTNTHATHRYRACTVRICEWKRIETEAAMLSPSNLPPGPLHLRIREETALSDTKRHDYTHKQRNQPIERANGGRNRRYTRAANYHGR